MLLDIFCTGEKMFIHSIISFRVISVFLKTNKNGIKFLRFSIYIFFEKQITVIDGEGKTEIQFDKLLHL